MKYKTVDGIDEKGKPTKFTIEIPTKYIRTKQGCIVDTTNMHPETLKWYQEVHLLKQADTIEELCDEIVLIENGNEHNVVYLQEAYDRIDIYHEQGNYEPRLIGRIKVGLDKKAVAEWKENEQGLYDWILL